MLNIQASNTLVKMTAFKPGIVLLLLIADWYGTTGDISQMKTGDFSFASFFYFENSVWYRITWIREGGYTFVKVAKE